MAKCEFCGQEVDLPFRCPFCNRNFCIEHRLPENHSCMKAPRRTPLGHWKAKKPTKSKKPLKLPTIPTKEGHLQKPTRKRKVAIAIGIGLIIIIVSIFVVSMFIFYPVTIQKTTETQELMTTCRVILHEISVFEDEACTKPIETIDWGYVESNHSYSHIVYARNDYAETSFDDRDIVWQRLNVNPSSVYISIKCDYGGKKIKPNEVRQVTITLTVLGLLEDSDKLNPNVEVPQFTFDLKLVGQHLSLWGGFPTYSYISCYCNRDANNITVVYKDDLKETISVFIEIKRREYYVDIEFWPVVWNTTKYASEFTETWLDADVYRDYQLTVTMNHERYGEAQIRSWYLVGQLP